MNAEPAPAQPVQPALAAQRETKRRLKLALEELERLRQRNQDLERDLAIARRLLLGNRPQACPPAQAKPPCPAQRPATEERQACAGCDLRGCKVAVIGGLDRMEPKYRKAVEELGGNCLFHPGRVQGGCQRLRQLVGKADLVVFMTSTNSHGALGVIKDECKRCDKPFCALANNGVSSLERTLRGFAA